MLEDGYGVAMDLEPEEYTSIDPRVRFATYREVFDQDVVVVIRCPDDEAIRWMRPGAMLVSMLHFPTRPWRARLLDELGSAD